MNNTATHPATTPARGFPRAEFVKRTAKMQVRMAQNKLDAIVLTTEANVRYFSGFFTQFWESPTRPWFLVIPAEGKPIAVIPEIGITGMADTWLDDIRTWASPCAEDDGISLLVDLLKSVCNQYGRLGMTLGPESYLRMPVANYQRLTTQLPQLELVDVAELMHQQRMIKSAREIEKIRHICAITSAAFQALPNMISMGMAEREICRQFRLDLIQRGADHSPYMVAGSGPGGYDSIIMGPSDRSLERGDVLIIDTGTVWDGYFCDFDRNFAFGHVDSNTQRANQVVFDAVEAGFAAAHPGNTTTDIWAAMNAVMVEGGSLGNEVGRLGHGLGMQLTERPSHTATDNTLLAPGMVLTLEPGMTFAPGKQMVHEENIVITENGAEWLSVRAARDIPIIH